LTPTVARCQKFAARCLLHNRNICILVQIVNHTVGRIVDFNSRKCHVGRCPLQVKVKDNPHDAILNVDPFHVLDLIDHITARDEASGAMHGQVLRRRCGVAGPRECFDGFICDSVFHERGHQLVVDLVMTHAWDVLTKRVGLRQERFVARKLQQSFGDVDHPLFRWKRLADVTQQLAGKWESIGGCPKDKRISGRRNGCKRKAKSQRQQQRQTTAWPHETRTKNEGVHF
jgi:hypothetical protein